MTAKSLWKFVSVSLTSLMDKFSLAPILFDLLHPNYGKHTAQNYGMFFFTEKLLEAALIYVLRSNSLFRCIWLERRTGRFTVLRIEIENCGFGFSTLILQKKNLNYEFYFQFFLNHNDFDLHNIIMLTLLSIKRGSFCSIRIATYLPETRYIILA